MSSSSASNPRELPNQISPIEEVLPFARIKLVAFDLDGTLLRDMRSLPGPRLLSLRRSSYQVSLTVATGRTLWGARQVIDALGGLESTPVVLYNGSVVVAGLRADRLRVLQRLTIPSVATHTIALQARRFGATVFAYEFRDSVIQRVNEDDWPEVVLVASDNPERVREFNGMTPRHCSVEDLRHTAPSAILVLPNEPDDCDRLVASFASIEEVSVTSSGGQYIEIRPRGVSKARGFEVLRNALGIERADVLAVGDNDNDVELMEWAGLSVAVKGASEAARHAATFISRHGAERAAIELLDIIRRARRLNKGRAGHVRRGDSGLG